MVEKYVLVASSVTYYHHNDEAAFFGWLDRMECVEGYRGEVTDLIISLRRRPTRYDLLELIAFFFRYGIDMAQLRRFETKANRGWLRDPKMYWHQPMFGDGG